MPRLNIVVPHSLHIDDARDRLKNLVYELARENGHHVTNMQYSWVNRIAHFSFQIMGFSIEGTLCVEPSMVRLEGSFPLAALPLKKAVERDILRTAQKLLRS